MPTAIVVRQPNDLMTVPSTAMVAISAIWPMLMAGMIQFAARPARSRNGLVNWK